MYQSILPTTPIYHRLQDCPTIILQEEIVAYLLFNFEVRRRGDGAVAAAATPRTAAAIQRLRQVDVPVVPILLPDLNNVQVLFSFHVPSPHVLLSSPLLSRSTLHGQLTPPLAPAPDSPLPFRLPPASVPPSCFRRPPLVDGSGGALRENPGNGDETRERPLRGNDIPPRRGKCIGMEML